MRARRLSLATSLLVMSGCEHPPTPPEPIDLVLPMARDGTPFDMSAHRVPSTVVYFFSTWCIPCQLEDAEVAEAYRDGANVVAVALDLEGARLVRPWVISVDPPYPVLVGGNRVASGSSPFGVIPELPALMFLDGKGRPAAVMTGVVPARTIAERAREVEAR